MAELELPLDVVPMVRPFREQKIRAARLASTRRRQAARLRLDVARVQAKLELPVRLPDRRAKPLAECTRADLEAVVAYYDSEPSHRAAAKLALEVVGRRLRDDAKCTVGRELAQMLEEADRCSALARGGCGRCA